MRAREEREGGVCRRPTYSRELLQQATRDDAMAMMRSAVMASVCTFFLSVTYCRPATHVYCN